MNKKNNSVIDFLENFKIWINNNCFKDETIELLISKIQFEINQQRKILKEKSKEKIYGK